MPHDVVRVRDVRNVERDKVRRSIILGVNDEGWCEVISAQGNPGDGPHVVVKLGRREASILRLTKDSYFRLDSIDWVASDAILEVAGKRCPPGLIERIRQMQQDAALGTTDRVAY